MEKYARGSEWRRWDLQVHTPASALNNNFGSDWDVYVKTLFNKAITERIDVIGITDYFCIEGYKKIKQEYVDVDNKLKVLFSDELKRDDNYIDKIRAIRLLPNIEFRFSDIIAVSRKNGKGAEDRKIEGHVIFSDEISIDDIENKVLASIKFLDEMNMGSSDRAPLMRSNIEALGIRLKKEQPTFTQSPYVVGLNNLVIPFDGEDSLMSSLTKNNSVNLENKYCIIIPEDDITLLDWNLGGAHQVRKKYYVKTHGFFSTNENTRNWGLKESTREEFKSYKPCFSCSDAHSMDEMFKFKSNINCWIKADPSFLGLLQVFFQPTERIYLGELPMKLDKVDKASYNYLDSIKIMRVINAKNHTNWFDNVGIALNTGLVAIIGNKGNGKSALADIFGYMTNSTNIKHASFLNLDRFRKEDKKYAKDYQAKLYWKDGRVIEKNSLDEPIVDGQLAEYLPQKYIDTLCNELNDSFQQEINNVIYSYIDKSERMEAINLEELLKKKTHNIETKIIRNKNKIESINKEIISLEIRLTSKYKKGIVDMLKKQKDKLEIHEKINPLQ